MSDIKNKTSDEIERIIQLTGQEMQTAQKNANYVEAENCQLKIQQLKKDFQVRKIYEMEQRQKKQIQQMNANQAMEIQKFEKYWQQKFKQHEQQSLKLQKETIARHEQQIQKMRMDLDKQLPIKIKESSQLLNLRKMEEHMVKQKNYGQAHKVQVRIQEIQAGQKQTWVHNRNMKIQVLINQHKAKQNAQLTALRKKIQTGLDQKEKEKKFQYSKLQKKFANINRELKMQQDKQVIHFRGQFKSKGGQSSPLKSNSRVK